MNARSLNYTIFASWREIDLMSLLLRLCLGPDGREALLQRCNLCVLCSRTDDLLGEVRESFGSGDTVNYEWW